MLNPKSVASLIDHTILKAEATQIQVLRTCREALEYQFASVCVNSAWVPTVAAELQGSVVKTCAVAGFPLGANASEVKVAEARWCLQEGAAEIDMVVNIGALKDGEETLILDEIGSLAEACHKQNALLKVIIEAALLTEEEKILACKLSVEGGADFVKTSTGFGPSGATASDVALMRSVVGPDIGVKASGGIRSLEDFEAMVNAGANRVGASASVAIVQAAIERSR